MLSVIRTLLFGFTVFVAASGSASATIILDAADANGIGDNGGSAFVFSFSALGPGLIEGALLEFDDYDLLGITISDSGGNVVLPLISNAPGQSILFDFMATSPLDFTASVFASGGGAFGLEIQQTSISSTAVPEPGTLAILALGLAGLGFGRRRAAT